MKATTIPGPACAVDCHNKHHELEKLSSFVPTISLKCGLVIPV